MKQELLFTNLYTKALKDWPESLDLKLETQAFDKTVSTDKGYDLVCYKNLPWDKSFDHYIVKDLYDLCENAEEKYFNSSEEILMRNLHMAIYYFIRKAAKYTTKFHLKDLRVESIQQDFDKRIKDHLNKEDEKSWGTEAIQLVKDYFAVNYPDKEKP
jgi:hypothetical protein